MRLKRISAITTLGVMWFGIGVFLLYKGIFLLMQALVTDRGVLIPKLKGIASTPDYAVMFLLSVSLLLGMLKGRFVLGKTARKTVSKILQTPEPIAVKEVFSFKYVVIIAFMISLGMTMNRSGLAFDIRGVIDVAVGSALIQGGMQYFRSALQIRSICGKETP